MRELPHTTEIRRTSTSVNTERVLCRRVLRSLPGKREVFDASWHGRGVIVKIFAHPFKAKRHVCREQRGLQRLAQLGIDAPVFLFSGQTEDGRWAIVTEKIQEAVSLQDTCARLAKPEERMQLLFMVSGHLARLHALGIVQRDFHAENFLIEDDRVTVLDPGQIHFAHGPVGRRTSIFHLARLIRILALEDHPDAVECVCAGYAAVRPWRHAEAARAACWKELRRGRREACRKVARRPLYKGKDHIRLRQGDGLAVVRRDFHQAADFTVLLRDIDGLIESGQVLERDAATLTSGLTWGAFEVVVKRFDGPGVFRSAVGILTGSYARRKWLAARRLTALRIGAVEPLAFIEKRRGLLPGPSYLVMPRVPGQTLCEFLRDVAVPVECKCDMVQQVVRISDGLARYGITYAGFRPKDTVVTRDGPVFLAYDGMVIHWLPARCRLRHARVMERFAAELRAMGFDAAKVGQDGTRCDC